MRKKICFVIGTRPEIIKLGPVYNYFRKKRKFHVSSYFTYQHTEIGQDVIEHFNFKIQKKKARIIKKTDLNQKMSSIIIDLKNYLIKNNISGIFVLGDTLTAMIASIVAFNLKVKIFYVESGLRTYDHLEPWPEEGYRRLISSVADYHFCPTVANKKNLLNENINNKKICVSGNPAIDAIHNEIKKYNKKYELKLINKIRKKGYQVSNKKLILVTIHRRENFGKRFENICKTIKYLSKVYKNYDFVITIHPNPYVKKTLMKYLANKKNIFLIKPLFYPEFIFALKKSTFVLSDSGGIQEELPTLKKYLILLREKTEREETIKLGYSFICGSSKKKIINVFRKLIIKSDYDNKFKYNPFGDGKSSARIYNFVKRNF